MNCNENDNVDNAKFITEMLNVVEIKKATYAAGNYKYLL